MNRQLLAGTAVVMFVISGSAKAQAPAPPPPTEFQVLTAHPNVPMAEVPKPSEMIAVKDVNAAVLPRTQAIAGCFQQALKANPKLEGKLTLLLTLETRGTKSRLKEGTVAGDYSLQNPFVGSCVLEALANVEFPAPKGADEVQLAYPLEFKPRGSGSAVGSAVLLPDEGDAVKRVAMGDRTERLKVELGNAPQTQPGAKVTLVIFTEYGCPFCAKGETVLRTLRQQYRGRVNFVFKHHPLASHPEAEAYARALYAAHVLGRFWDYHDQLFASGGDARALAQRLALDLQQFDRIRESDEARTAVQHDVAQAEVLGANGVPSFFINGRELVGARPFEELRGVIEEELAAARK